MPPDPNGTEFTEFQLEEIVLGRAQEARRQLAARTAGEDDPVRTRLTQVRSEIEGIQDALSAAGDSPDARVPGDVLLAGYLDKSLSDESRVNVERALAASAEARRRLVEMYHEVRACAEGESLPQLALPDDTIVPHTGALSSEPSEFAAARVFFVGGLLVAVLLWGGAIIGPVAWRTPSAFGAVAAVAMVSMHRFCASRLASMGRSQRRALQGCLLLVGCGGAALGFLDTGYVSIACSLVVSSLIVLFASAAGGYAERRKSADSAAGVAEREADTNVVSLREGSGGP